VFSSARSNLYHNINIDYIQSVTRSPTRGFALYHTNETLTMPEAVHERKRNSHKHFFEASQKPCSCVETMGSAGE